MWVTGVCFFSLSLFYYTVLSLRPLPQTPSPWTPEISGRRRGGEGVHLHICCCLSGVLSPTVGCVPIAVGAATRRVGQTDTELRPYMRGAFLLLLVRPQVRWDGRTLRPNMCRVSQFWCVMFDVCCCLSSVLSPTLGCVSVAVGVAASRVG